MNLREGDIVLLEYDYLGKAIWYSGYGSVLSCKKHDKATGRFRITSIWYNPLQDGEPFATLEPVNEEDARRLISTIGISEFSEPVSEIKKRIKEYVKKYEEESDDKF